jgi:tetratricopeptide (TPR) repeat protein
MTDDLSFRIPVPKDPEGKLLRAEQAEKVLLENLKKCEADYEEAMMNVAIFYSRTGRHELAMQNISRLMTFTKDPEKKADYVLGMGQLMEQIGNFEGAINFYRQAFSLEPVNSEVWYLINNNLGYCLNHFEQYAEAESYCQAAIKIEPKRQNAYKNLGISLEGQGRHADAARCYIKAVQANAGDPRALGHLEELLSKHEEVRGEIPDIEDRLEQCRGAVQAAAIIRKEFEDKLNRKVDEQEEDPPD